MLVCMYAGRAGPVGVAEGQPEPMLCSTQPLFSGALQAAIQIPIIIMLHKLISLPHYRKGSMYTYTDDNL